MEGKTFMLTTCRRPTSPRSASTARRTPACSSCATSASRTPRPWPRWSRRASSTAPSPPTADTLASDVVLAFTDEGGTMDTFEKHPQIGKIPAFASGQRLHRGRQGVPRRSPTRPRCRSRWSSTRSCRSSTRPFRARDDRPARTRDPLDAPAPAGRVGGCRSSWCSSWCWSGVVRLDAVGAACSRSRRSSTAPTGCTASPTRASSRTLLGLAVGAALGLVGALMQGLTRNPLADPGILGINAGPRSRWCWRSRCSTSPTWAPTSGSASPAPRSRWCWCTSWPRSAATARPR